MLAHIHTQLSIALILKSHFLNKESLKKQLTDTSNKVFFLKSPYFSSFYKSVTKCLQSFTANFTTCSFVQLTNWTKEQTSFDLRNTSNKTNT